MKSDSKPSGSFIQSEYDIQTASEYSNPMLVGGKPRLLLHACCGPCSTSCIERLIPDYVVTVFYYNPNITDEKEYILRRDTLKDFIRDFNRDNSDAGSVSFIEGEYHPDRYIEQADQYRDEPEGGARCDICFRMRLEETARVAKDLEMDLFTTTLTVSPHKSHDVISAIGRELSEYYDVEYLDIDFKKKNGYGRSIEMCREYGLYRQDFCGCEYARYREKSSKTEGR